MAPQTSRIARLKEFLAFVIDQALQFWPPYRTEIEGEGTRARVVPLRSQKTAEPEAPAPLHADQAPADRSARRG
jgi:hypothetical protein